jgi:AAA15 family ATPase/GTPase
VLNSLEIKNFRLLENFQVKKLGQVNLIVGKNNSGKSSVLEALRIYAGNANKALLIKIAKSHNEKYLLEEDDYLSKVANNNQVEGVLFRVGKSIRKSEKGRVIATVFDKEQLYNITQSDVEVR